MAHLLMPDDAMGPLQYQGFDPYAVPGTAVSQLVEALLAAVHRIDGAGAAAPQS
jgi:hypothetical protein